MQIFREKSFRKFEIQMRKNGQNILEYMYYHRTIKHVAGEFNEHTATIKEGIFPAHQPGGRLH